MEHPGWGCQDDFDFRAIIVEIRNERIGNYRMSAPFLLHFLAGNFELLNELCRQ